MKELSIEEKAQRYDDVRISYMIKSYTDLEQSKILAKILPLESADMSYMLYDNHITLCPYVKMINDGFDKNEVIPCWSLAALLSVLPGSCDDGQHCLVLINSNPNGEVEWLCSYEDCMGNLMMECYADNQVDACYELILKLHELNLL